MKSLNEGNFLVPVCSSCRNKVWPPSRLCPLCYSETSLEEVETVGTLLEFSKSHIERKEGMFGIVDLGGIKIVGGLKSDRLKEGMKLRMSACGVREDGSPFYDFEPL